MDGLPGGDKMERGNRTVSGGAGRCGVRREGGSWLMGPCFPTTLWTVAVAAAALWVPLFASQPGAVARRPHFVDVALRSRILHFTNNGYTGRKYFQQPM